MFRPSGVLALFLSRCEQSRTPASKAGRWASKPRRARPPIPYLYGLKKLSAVARSPAAPFIRDVLARFRGRALSAHEAASELGLSRSRFY